MSQKIYEVIDASTEEILNIVVVDDIKKITPEPGTKLRLQKPKKLVNHHEPEEIDENQFIDLLQEFGGTSDEQLVALYEDSSVKIKLFFIKMKNKQTFSLREQFVLSGIDSLFDAGYIPNGKRSIFDNWPSVVYLDAV